MKSVAEGDGMKVLVVGSGGREHALTWKCAESNCVTGLFAAPGNPGMAEHAQCVGIRADDLTGIGKFAVKENIDLVVVGPEVPLCLGIVDLLEEAGIAVFGPSNSAARIEGSKAFSKRIMRKYGIPTAAFEHFRDFESAAAYARSLGGDMWIKASGLAAGKGAVYAADPGEAEAVLRDMMVDDRFGESGHEVVIEENMTGEEASIFALCDGSSYKLLVSSHYHKRIYDGDKGLNTGGMGAYAPAPIVSQSVIERIEREVLQPTLDGMAREGSPYKGLLYAGIMVTDDGPKVVEYNCRFGDPETQAVLPLFEGDLVEALLACARGDISKAHVGVSGGFAMCVVIASGGYPESYAKGYPVSGLSEAGKLDNVRVFHAGTVFDGDRVVTAGGRVFGVTGWGADFNEARERAYSAAGMISFENMHYRKDIGRKALKYFK